MQPSETETLTIILPERSEDGVSVDLRYLTEVLHCNGMADGEQGGALGGEFGYGADFENDTFRLNRFCWCERPDCQFCLSCECGEDAARYFLADGNEVEEPAFYKAGGYSTGRVEKVPERQCVNCREERKPSPLFLHKPSGSNVSWYKYIGRSMEINVRVPWQTVMSDCLASLGGGSRA